MFCTMGNNCKTQIFLFMLVSISLVCNTTGCGDGQPSIQETVGNSHYVVYGEITEKILDPVDVGQPGVETFTATMKVLCTLKGDRLNQFINITKAGRRSPGICFINDFELQKKYVAYLRLQNSTKQLIPDWRETSESEKNLVFQSCGLSSQNLCPSGLVQMQELSQGIQKMSECPLVPGTICPTYTPATGKPPPNPVPTLPASPTPTPAPLEMVYCVQEIGQANTSVTPGVTPGITDSQEQLVPMSISLILSFTAFISYF